MLTFARPSPECLARGALSSNSGCQLRQFSILERNLIGADFDHVLGNHFLNCERVSGNQQNNAINCDFRQVSPKRLITLKPKIYPFFSKSLSKIQSANVLPGLLPMGQVRRKCYLPEGKIYLSQTTGRRFFRALLGTLRFATASCYYGYEK